MKNPHPEKIYNIQKDTVTVISLNTEYLGNVEKFLKYMYCS